MKIYYYLVDNPITEDPNDCHAQVTGYESVTEEQIIEYITRKGSGVTTAEAMGNYQEIMEAHEYFLKMGYGIRTAFLNARPTISGVFKDKNDTFDSTRHQINFRVKFGKHYKETSKNVQAEKTEPTRNEPILVDFKDVTSDTINESVTPGGACMLTGARLKFDTADPAQGIFFILNGTATKVSTIITMQPSQIVFLVPQGLIAGEYSLEVRNMVKGGKELKKGSLKDTLTV
jgi:hypothetical protein